MYITLSPAAQLTKKIKHHLVKSEQSLISRNLITEITNTFLFFCTNYLAQIRYWEKELDILNIILVLSIIGGYSIRKRHRVKTLVGQSIHMLIGPASWPITVAADDSDVEHL